jgi:hypothetical protein
VAEVLTVTNRDYYFRCKDEFQLAAKAAASRVPAGYLLEPMGRNTAPAIALAALYVRWQHGPDAVMLVLPSDHLIADVTRFQRERGQRRRPWRAPGWLTTFGIRPTAPETGFGYLLAGEADHSRRQHCRPESPALCGETQSGHGPRLRGGRQLLLEWRHVLLHGRRLPGRAGQGGARTVAGCDMRAGPPRRGPGTPSAACWNCRWRPSRLCPTSRWTTR